MAQISIRNNLLKRYNNKFRRNEVRQSRQRRSRLLVVAMQACACDNLARIVTCVPISHVTNIHLINENPITETHYRCTLQSSITVNRSPGIGVKKTGIYLIFALTEFP